MSVADKLDYLKETKEAIKSALIDKGVEVSDNDTFRSYAEKISNIPSGGESEDIEEVNSGLIILPNMSEYDATKCDYIRNTLNSVSDILDQDQYLKDYPPKVKFQSALTSIASYGFSGHGRPFICDFSECHNLEIIPEKLFYTSGIKEVLLPDGLKEIHNLVFLYATLSSDLYIPNSVEIILEGAFDMCDVGTIYIDKEPGSIEGAPWSYDESKIVWLRS